MTARTVLSIDGLRPLARAAGSWLRDDLALRRLKAKVRAAFPDIGFKHVELVGDGNDHAVLILDDRWVFRFPRNAHFRQSLPFEISLLRALRDHTIVSVPDYAYVAPSAAFGGYAKIRGRRLLPATFHSLNRSTQEGVLRGIADLLGGLHALPTALIVRDGELPALGQKYTDEWPVEERTAALKLVGPQLLGPLTEFYAAHAAPMTYPNKRLLHGDLTGKHILLDDDLHRIGCIDFSDAVAGDPAWDFAFLSSYGPWTASFVFDRYALAADEPGLVDRSLWLAPKLGISSLRWRLTRSRPNPVRIAEAVRLLETQLANVGLLASAR